MNAIWPMATPPPEKFGPCRHIRRQISGGGRANDRTPVAPSTNETPLFEIASIAASPRQSRRLGGPKDPLLPKPLPGVRHRSESGRTDRGAVRE